MKRLPIACIRAIWRWLVTPLRLFLAPLWLFSRVWWWFFSPLVYAEGFPLWLHSVLWWLLLAWVALVRKLWFWMGPWAPQVLQWRREIAEEGV